MDALKQQLLKVQQQLTGLSASQKMLTASLLVIMVMTLFYWSNVAGHSEMEAVIDSPLTPDEMAAVQNAVRAKGLKYEVKDGKVLVPVGKRDEVTAVMDQLGYDGSLPAAYAKAEETSDSSMAFMSEAARQSKLQDTRRKRVESMIQRWPGVRGVQVILAGERQTGIMHDSAPVASVSIDTRTGAGDLKKMAASARKLVLGAQPGLKPDDVQVFVNSESFDANSNQGTPAGGSDEQFIIVKARELRFQQAILQQLQYIPGVRATVVGKMNNADVTTDERIVDNKNMAVAPKWEKTTETSTPMQQPNGEPGATTNLAVNADTNASPEQQAATSNSREKTNEVQFGVKNVTTKNRGGEVTAATAVVSVPESYFRNVWKGRNADAKREPKDDEVQAVAAKYLPEIRRAAKLAVNIPDDGAVQVATYYDFEPVPVADPTAGAGLAALPTGSGFGAKEIAVAALAVISLFMVAMMVRKSNPQPVLATATMGPASATESIPDGHGMLTVGDVIGEVGEGNLTMAGHELSPEAIEAEQVIHQVGTMVKANPDIAANLVKRWLNQD